MLFALTGCVRAGFEGQTASSEDAASGVDASLADGVPDVPVAPPGVKISGGPGDPAWSGVTLGSTSVKNSTVVLDEQVGFAVKDAKLTSGRAWGAAAAVKDRIYLFGGGTKLSASSSTTEILQYVPATDTIAPVASLPYGLLGLQAVTAGDGNVYLVMGLDPTVSKTREARMLRFDPLQHATTTAFGGLYAAYHHGSALGNDGVIYSFGGYGSGPLKDIIEGFKPSTKTVVKVGVSLVGPQEKLRAYAASNGKIYLFGGALGHHDDAHLGTKLSDKIYRFTPSPPALALVTTAKLPEPLINLAGGVLPDGGIYLVGGDAVAVSGSKPTAKVFRFDPQTETLTTTPDTLTVALSGAAAAVGKNGKLYLFGGRTTSGLATRVLELHPYAKQGQVSGPVIDTGAQGTTWSRLEWGSALPAGTALTMQVRAAAVPFSATATAPAWQDSNETPVTSGLPSGRYIQWRATSTTTNSANTPALLNVTVRYGDT